MIYTLDFDNKIGTWSVSNKDLYCVVIQHYSPNIVDEDVSIYSSPNITNIRIVSLDSYFYYGNSMYKANNISSSQKVFNNIDNIVGDGQLYVYYSKYGYIRSTVVSNTALLNHKMQTILKYTR